MRGLNGCVHNLTKTESAEPFSSLGVISDCCPVPEEENPVYLLLFFPDNREEAGAIFLSREPSKRRKTKMTMTETT